MLTSQKIEIRRSELRERLAALADIEQPSNEQQSELGTLETEYRATESRLRAALLSEEGNKPASQNGRIPDAEERERRSLLDRSRVGAFVRAAIEGRELSAGPEVEASAACDCPPGYIPYEMLEARAATTVPSGSEHTDIRPIQPNIFGRKHAAFLGIDMPMVSHGLAVYPVITGSTPAGEKAPGAAAAETAATVSVSTIKPRRVTGSIRVRLEDLATLPDLESALRRDIGDSIANKVDAQQIAGSGTSPAISGLLAGLTDPTNPTTEATYASYLADIVGKLEGIHGNELSDVRMLVGMTTYAHMFGQSPTNDDSVSAYEKLRSLGVQIRAAGTDWIAAAASNVQQAVVRLGMRPMVAVNPIWQGLQLIRDPYSSAPSGEVRVVAVAMIGDAVKLLHGAAFSQTSYKIA